MKIINKTGKVVGIGSLTLLPDGSGELPVSFGNNPIIADMVRNGELAFDTEDVKVQADAEAAKAAKRPPSRLPKKRRRKTLPLRLKAQQPR